MLIIAKIYKLRMVRWSLFLILHWFDMVILRFLFIFSL